MGQAGPLDVVINLLLALVLSLIMTFVYRQTHTGFAYSKSFNTTLVAVAMVVTMIMMVIGNYLALSLGLVGALSVIRFRSAIKDPRDIAYLFLSIAIGLACSTGNYENATIGTLAITATLYGLHLFRFGSMESDDYCLTFCLAEGAHDPKEIVTKSKSIFSKITFRSYAHVSDDIGEYVSTVRLGKETEEAALDFLKKEFPKFQNLSLIAPESRLEV